MQIVNLTEWETRGPTCNGPLAGPVLAGYPSARRIAETLTRDGRVEILELARGLQLRATSYVGRFALGNSLITIKPKISGVPLMNLLRYAYRLRNLHLLDEVDHTLSKAGFEDLLIQQLAAESSELLSRGIHRDYLRTESQLLSHAGGFLLAVIHKSQPMADPFPTAINSVQPGKKSRTFRKRLIEPPSDFCQHR